LLPCKTRQWHFIHFESPAGLLYMFLDKTFKVLFRFLTCVVTVVTCAEDAEEQTWWWCRWGYLYFIQNTFTMPWICLIFQVDSTPCMFRDEAAPQLFRCICKFCIVFLHKQPYIHIVFLHNQNWKVHNYITIRCEVEQRR